jgi:hypothetical protein
VKGHLVVDGIRVESQLYGILIRGTRKKMYRPVQTAGEDTYLDLGDNKDL